ncbi:hypothetical protein [Nesterenkonia flava]|uniref:Uncharacterized protein n=1 Tax=Nesterenkonia flava TaxID=469799 RepID=A0ABU1FX85_9MICC|nr:hypothetical protein [Nesterenkonia flava]MDR5712952.1 hypothetical protein [Nesterenkonia flava]
MSIQDQLTKLNQARTTANRLDMVAAHLEHANAPKGLIAFTQGLGEMYEADAQTIEDQIIQSTEEDIDAEIVDERSEKSFVTLGGNDFYEGDSIEDPSLSTYMSLPPGTVVQGGDDTEERYQKRRDGFWYRLSGNAVSSVDLFSLEYHHITLVSLPTQEDQK